VGSVSTQVYRERNLKVLGETLSTGYINGEAPAPWPTPNAPHSNWYAIYTRPSHEKRVAEHFALREIECYFPSYRTTRRWKNRCKVELELPLFPGYVFARFQWCQRIHVLEVPSVVSIIGNGREPLPLQHSEIAALRAGLDLHRAEPHPYLNIGERVRIKLGPLTGFEGIVVRKTNGLRVILTLQQIMKSVAVEIEEHDLELLGNSLG
jgi:transcription antitermination factor NusG